MIKKNGILFDLDGTLWEVKNITYKSANQITKKYNLKEVSIETICSGFGLNRKESAKNYFPYLDIDKAIQLINEIGILNIKNLKKYGGNLYPNLENVLKKLKEEYELFIVSNTGHIEYIEAFLSSSKLNKYFKEYIAASALNISKSTAIQKVIKDNNLIKAVYVGDTIKDKEASEAAGVTFIQAKYGFGKDLKTKYSIDSISELPGIIDKIFPC